MSRTTTLTDAILPTDSLAKKAMLVIGASWLIAVAAQISVPMMPVPMTFQTLAILFVGFSLGARMGAAALVAYLAQGAAGLPVFANGMNGIAFFGPTAGFLIGFVGMAWIAGFAADRGFAKGFVGTAVTALVASVLLYIPGLAWPMLVAAVAGIDAGWVGQNMGFYWEYFTAPFLAGDALKAVIVALLVTGAWKVADARG